ncbi:hypothetical protein Ssi02_46790 [Sinosporangium siamense]|uniref:Uncharacterized protein n=1 Tax=Sinosporangium siamense TaxID=1367973 RepID=A0A919RIV6_9ACTN|nr:hypothetical protein Ssi02_46790 [Sinosporangium siamense]
MVRVRGRSLPELLHNPPPGGAYGPEHRCVPLIPEKGDLILDVVRNRITYVEVLYYPSLRGATSQSSGPDRAQD